MKLERPWGSQMSRLPMRRKFGRSKLFWMTGQANFCSKACHIVSKWAYCSSSIASMAASLSAVVGRAVRLRQFVWM